MGVEGLEPTTFRLRAGSSNPTELHTQDGYAGSRTQNSGLKRPVLYRLSYVPKHANDERSRTNNLRALTRRSPN